MAIYWTMGVDCGTDQALADRIVQHFDGYLIALPDGAPLVCKSHVETHRGIHFVCVYPRGMGFATHPENERRPELANDHTESLVRDVLYSELRSLLGFRRALFGAECFDQMTYATPEEDSDIDYGYMISSTSDFPHAPPDRTSQPFASGYRIVTAMRAPGDNSASGEDVTASISANVRKLECEDSAERESAGEALYHLAATGAMPSLLNALIAETDACPWIGTAIVEIGPSKDDIPKLRVALRSPNSHVRFWAARACVKLGTSARPLIGDLIRLLNDSHHPVSDSACWALGSIGARSIPKLIEVATGDDAEMRGRAILALGRYAEDLEQRLPTVLDSLDDPDGSVRSCAARAICSLGQQVHGKTEAYSTTTIKSLVDALEKISSGAAIEIETDWPQRVLGWLKSSE